MKVVTLFGAAAIVLTLHSCQSNQGTSDNKKGIPKQKANAASGATYEGYIQKETANRMIGSYLQSIDHGNDPNDPNLYSLILDANTMRDYVSNPEIEKVKVMFAHTMDYIESGHEGQNAGYHSGALTVVLAGYNADGNYVYSNGNMVMDHAVPCPKNCQATGTASKNLLQ